MRTWQPAILLRPAAAGVVAMLLAAMTAAAARAAAPSEAELLAGADARIEKHRQADAAVAVLDAAGQPVPNARVEIRQSRHAFLFGCNAFGLGWDRVGDETQRRLYGERFAELLNFATLPFYWWSYEPRSGEPRHEQTERTARWCAERGIVTKGHPLAWNYVDPPWLPQEPDEVRRLQVARVGDCARRFAGQIDRWDVVNEATHFDRDELLRQAPRLSAAMKQTGAVEYTRQCFVAARQANPKATLLINDYRTDPAYERLIEKLTDTDGRRLYDVIGIQSHMHGGAWPAGKVWEVCERFARFGVPLHFTETTVLSGERTWNRPRGTPWPSTPDGEAYQARAVTQLYTLLFSHPAVEAITWWDLSDARAWKGAPAGLIRADMSPKPAYDELRKLIKGKWWTSAAASTAADGSAAFRAFLGEHRVTVVAGQRRAEATITVRRGEPNRFTVTLR